MAIVTGDLYLNSLVNFVQRHTEALREGAIALKINPVGLNYVQSRLDALHELESIISGAPVDYLRAHISDLGDHRSLEQLRRILRLLTSLKVVSVLPPPSRDPTPISLFPFSRLRVLELRGCNISPSSTRGMLELNHTLEKIICQNSTDALRHVFASRVIEVKDSPHWNRLSVVSCPCNGLALMDESLQLLPAVEILDLSRNKLTKVDNLQKCTKLKNLDLGFNHLRTISSFNQVFCQLVKLVLRNNALSTLSGIENLKSLEGIDLSHNLISKISELGYLALLPSLRCLWLEGNPLCCLRWYRANVFSFFFNPHMLKIDGGGISMKETLQMQIIISMKKKRPGSFGFYAPVHAESKEEDSVNTRKKKLCRVASIEGEPRSLYMDHDSPSCESEGRSIADCYISDGESGISGFIERIELMKERSVLDVPERSASVGDGCSCPSMMDEQGDVLRHCGYVEDDLDSGSVTTSSSNTSGYDDVGTSGSDDCCEIGPSTANPHHMESEKLNSAISQIDEAEFIVFPSGDGASVEKVGRRRARRRVVSLSEDCMT